MAPIGPSSPMSGALIWERYPKRVIHSSARVVCGKEVSAR